MSWSLSLRSSSPAQWVLRTLTSIASMMTEFCRHLLPSCTSPGRWQRFLLASSQPSMGAPGELEGTLFLFIAYVRPTCQNTEPHGTTLRQTAAGLSCSHDGIPASYSQASCRGLRDCTAIMPHSQVVTCTSTLISDTALLCCEASLQLLDRDRWLIQAFSQL